MKSVSSYKGTQKDIKPVNPLKLIKPPKPTKAMGMGVKKRAAKPLVNMVVLKDEKGGNLGAKIKDIEIKSSRGRIIRPTAKRVNIKKK